MSNLIPVTIMVTPEEADILVNVLEYTDERVSDMKDISLACAWKILG